MPHHADHEAGFPGSRDAGRARHTRRTRVGCGDLCGVWPVPLPRAVLEIEGTAEPADIAIIGSAAEVRGQFETLAAAGVTDVNALPFAVDGDPHVMTRTYEFLAELARAGV